MNKKKQTLSKWSADGVEWFAIFVKTYEEMRMAEKLQAIMDAERYFAFVPTTDYPHTTLGKTTMRKIPWLKGYVFIATSEGAEECTRVVEPLMKNESTIFKFVSYDRTRNSITISNEDKTILASILDEDFHIPAIKAMFINGKVKILENALEANGGKVVKITKHRKSAMVQLALLGEQHLYEIALEFVASSALKDWA